MAINIDGDGLIALGGTASTQGRVRLAEDTDNGTNYIELTAPASVASDRTITFPDATGTVVISGTTPSLNGITFPATQVASADVNTLDDYEEGTWSPVITDGTNDATMNAATGGFYTKMGRLVLVNGFCYTSSKGSITTGALFMKGLPFTIFNDSANYGGGTIGVADQLAITANQVAILSQDAVNVTRVRLSLWKLSTGTDALTGSNWNNTGYIGFTYAYITAT
jgi:hypothetical protein